MQPSELTPGVVINYRWQPATVIECWTRAEDVRDGFAQPIGAVIEWQEGDTLRRCRLLWDSDTATADGLHGELILWNA